MSVTEQTTSTPSGAPSAVEAPAPADAFAEMIKLARGSASQPGFLTQAMRAVARHFASPYTAIHVRYASEVVQDDWHTGPTDPQFWRPTVQEFLTDSLAEPIPRARLLRAKKASTKVALMSAPIFDPSGKTIGALALVVAPIEEEQLDSHLATLRALTGLASYVTAFVGAPDSGAPGVTSRAGSSVQPASARALAQAAAYATMQELAFAITNDLCNKLGCEQVALGQVTGSRVNVVSISGMDTVHHQSPGVVSLRSAMEECLDAAEPIVFQSAGGWTSDEAVTGHRLHKQWHAAVQGDAVASIPLRVGDRLTAILSLRRRAGEPFTVGQIEDIRARVEPFVPALVLTHRASRGLLRHARDSLAAGVHRLTRPDRIGAKAVGAAVVMAALWFVFGSINYDITVPCVVNPTHIRHVTAPFDGVLVSASVIEGDYVNQGDVLCKLDHRELNQERAQWLAELAVLERTHDRAMADNSPAEARLASANQELIQAKLDIVNRRIERATLIAPIDGVIVAGDLRKLIGSVVTRGDPFFEVAPLHSWTLELEVPESASADLTSGLRGFFASYAQPARTRELEVLRVLPEAQNRRGHNVYVAEAEVGSPADWLRPGLEGVAKIHLGRRRVWWIVLHRAVDYLRMNLWL